METQIFDFICSEFNGVQRQRALKLFYNKKISKKDLKLFYSNWIIRIKFELKNWLDDYEKVYTLYKLLKRNSKKYNDINNTNIIVLANYTVECKELEIRMEELENIITSIGKELLNMLKKIEELNLFNANDIATIFSIPMNVVEKCMSKYKNSNNGVIFNILITEFSESILVRNEIKDTQLSLMPFYWSNNMAYLYLQRI